jgi:ABC-type phosphate/phosphonate transport system substrate-binding protein
MTLIKLGFLTLFLVNSFNTMACDTPVSLQAGPFFSTALVIKYWQPFSKSVEAISGCETNITTAPTYDEYLKSIINKKNDIYVAPDHYVSAFIDLGIKPILSSYKTAQVYLVSRHPIKNGDLNSLHGDVIIVPSRYTRAFLELKAWLIQNGLFDKVSFDFDHSHDSAALLMLKGKRSSTVMLASIYDTLPEFIKSKYHAIKLNTSSGAYILAKEDLDPAIVEAMIQSVDKLNFHKWYTTKAIPKEPYSDEFKAQLKAFRKANSL